MIDKDGETISIINNQDGGSFSVVNSGGESNIEWGDPDGYMSSSSPYVTLDQITWSAKKIDFDKVYTLQDLINIIEALDIQIWDHKDERYDKIRHLLKDPE